MSMPRPRAGFYGGALELHALLETKTLCAYEVGGQSVLLIFLRGASLHTQRLAGGARGEIPPHDGAGPLHIASRSTPRRCRMEEQLGRHGVTIEGRTQWERGGQSVYFRDPDGHLLELMTRQLGDLLISAGGCPSGLASRPAGCHACRPSSAWFHPSGVPPCALRLPAWSSCLRPRWARRRGQKTFRVNVVADPAQMDPVTVSEIVAGRILRNVYEGSPYRDDGRNVPALAEKGSRWRRGPGSGSSCARAWCSIAAGRSPRRT